MSDLLSPVFGPVKGADCGHKTETVPVYLHRRTVVNYTISADGSGDHQIIWIRGTNRKDRTVYSYSVDLPKDKETVFRFCAALMRAVGCYQTASLLHIEATGQE